MKVKFKKQIVKTAIPKHPYYTEVVMRVFKYKDEDYGFAYNVPANFEFTHVRSGLGFNGTNAKTLNTAFDSFMSAVETKRDKVFTDYIQEAKSLEDHIKEKEETQANYKKENDRRHKVINELRNLIHVSIPFCKTVIIGRIAIDIVAFDDNLKKYYGNSTYPENMSMKQFITNQWGEDVAAKVKSVL